MVTSILPIWNYSICTFLVLVSRIFYLWYIICFFVASIFVLVATIFFLVTFFFFLSNFNITNLRWLNLYLSHLFLCKGSNAPQKLFPIVFSCYLFRFGASDIREPFIVLFFFFFSPLFFLLLLFFVFSVLFLFLFCFNFFLLEQLNGSKLSDDLLYCFLHHTACMIFLSAHKEMVFNESVENFFFSLF